MYYPAGSEVSSEEEEFLDMDLLGEGQGLYERKKQMLEAKTKEGRRLEEDRKVIPSSQKLSDTIDVF